MICLRHLFKSGAVKTRFKDTKKKRLTNTKKHRQTDTKKRRQTGTKKKRLTNTKKHRHQTQRKGDKQAQRNLDKQTQTKRKTSLTEKQIGIEKREGGREGDRDKALPPPPSYWPGPKNNTFCGFPYKMTKLNAKDIKIKNVSNVFTNI